MNFVYKEEKNILFVETQKAHSSLFKNISHLMRIFPVQKFFVGEDLVGKMLDYLTYLSESQTGML